MILTVDKIVKETSDAVSVIFKKPGFFSRIKYLPGQFLTLKIPFQQKTENRAYSLSSSPWTHNFLRITVKKIEEGLVSNFICDELKEGQKIEVIKPTGNFFINPNKRKQNQYVLFAGGSGITPIYSILLSILKKEPKSKVTLIYANSSEQSVIFKEDLKNLSKEYQKTLTIHYLYSKPVGEAVPQNNIHFQRLDFALLEHILEQQGIEFKQPIFMLCGPQGFMDTAVDILKSKNVAPEKIKLEAFTIDEATLLAGSSGSVGSTVKVIGTGSEEVLQVPQGKTILQSAIDQGVEIPYSCRSGMCSSCKARCKTGRAKMLDGHLLSDSDVEQGYILTCVAFPETENLEIILPQ